MAQNNALYSFTLTIKNSNGSAYDLTGRTLKMQFKNTTGAAAGATLSTGDGSLAVQSPSTAGIVVGTISQAAMAAMAAGVWYWDLLDETSAGLFVFLGAGTLKVTQGITDSSTGVMPSRIPTVNLGVSDFIVTIPSDALTLTLAPSGPPGAFPVLTADPAPGSKPTPYFLTTDGGVTFSFRIMWPDGRYTEIVES